MWRVRHSRAAETEEVVRSRPASATPAPEHLTQLAYVTVLDTDDYADGVLALHASLQSVKARMPLWVLTGRRVSAATKLLLSRCGVIHASLDGDSALPPERVAADGSGATPHGSFSFEKLLAFSLGRFEKIVLLDSGMIVLRNIDHLFARPHMSAVAAGAYGSGDHPWGSLNNGLMVMAPRAIDIAALTGLIPAAVAPGGRWPREQDIIHQAFPDWPERADLHLAQGYNLFTSHLDFYMSELGYRWRGHRGVYVLHFTGAVKPWMLSAGQRLSRCLLLLRHRRPHECVALLMHACFVARGRANV